MPTETEIPTSYPYSLLNLGDALKAMQLVNEITVKMNRMIGTKDNLISISIKNAIEDKVPYIKIIQEIKDMATDNRNMMADVIGLKLTHEILNFGKSS